MKLCETLIKASLNKNSETLLVVPFVGSGSECVMAKKLNVNFIGFEINPVYVELSNKRLNDENDEDNEEVANDLKIDM